MKRVFMLLTLVMGLSCLSLYAQSSKGQEKRDSKAQLVQEMIQSKNYVVNCDRIYPLRGRSRYVGGNYSLEVKGDTIKSYLPYIGVAYSANYNGKNVMDFEKGYTNYTFKEGKKNSYIVSFTVDNENEKLDYQLTIYPNGSARIYIQPLRRDAVSYSGELEFPENKK